MAWINYHQEFLAQFEEEDGVIIFHNKSKLPFFVARTLYEGHFVPGYAVNGVGYFVSIDIQPFQTSNFQVLVQAQVKFSKSHERGIVTDDEDQEMRFSIGTFHIEEKRFCGLVIDNEICCINFDDQVVIRYAPKFKFIANKTTNPSKPIGDSQQDNNTIRVKAALRIESNMEKIKRNQDEIKRNVDELKQIKRRRMQ